MADKVLISLGEFPKTLIDGLSHAKSAIELGEKIELNLSLKIEIDEEALRAYNEEFEKLKFRMLS